MFLGIYALDGMIIGYQYTSIDRREQATYAVASILLMVLDLALLVVDELLGLFGFPGPVTVLHDGRALTGRAVLDALSFVNRSREPEEDISLMKPSITMLCLSSSVFFVSRTRRRTRP